MRAHIADDDKEIIDRHWATLICCPVIHHLMGSGYIESYSNGIYTIHIGDENSFSSMTILCSALNHNKENWNVDYDELHKEVNSLIVSRNEFYFYQHQHLSMLEILELGIIHI
jgi:hypothetical protein